MGSIGEVIRNRDWKWMTQLTSGSGDSVDFVTFALIADAAKSDK